MQRVNNNQSAYFVQLFYVEFYIIMQYRAKYIEKNKILADYNGWKNKKFHNVITIFYLAQLNLTIYFSAK